MIAYILARAEINFRCRPPPQTTLGAEANNGVHGGLEPSAPVSVTIPPEAAKVYGQTVRGPAHPAPAEPPSPRCKPPRYP